MNSDIKKLMGKDYFLDEFLQSFTYISSKGKHKTHHSCPRVHAGLQKHSPIFQEHRSSSMRVIKMARVSPRTPLVCPCRSPRLCLCARVHLLCRLSWLFLSSGCHFPSPTPLQRLSVTNQTFEWEHVFMFLPLGKWRLLYISKKVKKK